MSDRLRTVVDNLADEGRTYSITGSEKLRVVLAVSGKLTGSRRRRFELVGIGAEVEILGALDFSANDQVHLEVAVNHAVRETRSRTHIRTIMRDQAQLRFRGMIAIARDAQKSDAFLRQESLLLSSASKVDSEPGLEIEADDVKASHAATAAPVDKEQLFYLRSRGLSQGASEKLLVDAFLAPIREAAMRVE